MGVPGAVVFRAPCRQSTAFRPRWRYPSHDVGVLKEPHPLLVDWNDDGSPLLAPGVIVSANAAEVSIVSMHRIIEREVQYPRG